jgi:crotonobetainyl-CoA:carnitine CoA-transferase CaiB-like acyl-CoA transferase
MLDTMVAYLWPEGMSGYTFIGKEVKASRAQFAQDLIFQTSDGYITAGAVSDAEWHGMCRALEREEWLEDDRFRTANDRIVNVRERLALTAEVLETRPSREWLERLDAEGVPCAPVLERHEVFEHEQVKINEMVSEYDHPTAGRIRQPRPAARFDRTPATIRRHAPALGEHSDEILEELGFDAAALRSQGVIG